MENGSISVRLGSAAMKKLRSFLINNGVKSWSPDRGPGKPEFIVLLDATDRNWNLLPGILLYPQFSARNDFPVTINLNWMMSRVCHP